MKTLTAALLTGVLLAALGCQQEPLKAAAQPGIAVSGADKGLQVAMQLPQRNLYRGQVVPIKVTATNTTQQELAIPAETGSPVYVTVLRKTGAGWEQVKRLPETPVMVAKPWKLAPGVSHTFILNVTVSPDWPTGEPLRVTAELNGRPQAKATANIQVFATEAECKRFDVY